MERSVLKMPAVALRGMTILPGMITHFDVSRSRSAKAVERSVAQDQKLFVGLYFPHISKCMVDSTGKH